MANRMNVVTNVGNGSPIPTISLDTTGQWVVGDASESMVGSIRLEISGTFVGSLVLRARITGGVATNAAANAACYDNALTGATNVAPGTAITAAGAYIVKVDVAQLIFDYTATSGTMVVEYRPFVG